MPARRDCTSSMACWVRIRLRFIYLIAGCSKPRLQAVEALAEIAFSGDDWLDRRGFLAMLRTDLFFTRDFPHWRRNPQVHCDAAMGAIFDLGRPQHRQTCRKALPNIESRLAKIPAFLSAGAACLKDPVPLWSKLAVAGMRRRGAFPHGTGEGACGDFHEPRAHREDFLGCDRRIQVVTRAQSGIKSRGTRTVFPSGGKISSSSSANGLACRSRCPEAEALGRKLVEQLTHLQKIEAAKFGQAQGRGNHRGSRRGALAARRGPLIEEYRAGHRADARRVLRRPACSRFPRDETLKVLPVPEFLRHQFPTAAYSQPGCYDKKQTGIFWVNDLSLLQKDPEKKKAEVRQHFGLELTCAHEAYPGHHAQFVIQNRHAQQTAPPFSPRDFLRGLDPLVRKNVHRAGHLPTRRTRASSRPATPSGAHGASSSIAACTAARSITKKRAACSWMASASPRLARRAT